MYLKADIASYTVGHLLHHRNGVTYAGDEARAAEQRVNPVLGTEFDPLQVKYESFPDLLMEKCTDPGNRSRVSLGVNSLLCLNPD